MAAYATAADVAKGYRPLAPDEIPVATELLERARAKLDAYMRGHAPENDAEYVEMLRICSCEMVQRALSGSKDAMLYAPEAYDGASWNSMTPAMKVTVEASERAALRPWRRATITSVRPHSWAASE